MDEFDIRASIAAQDAYCDREKVPHFAPLDGICYSCGQQIYARLEHRNPYNGKKTYTGIPTDLAGTSLITGCPHCSHTYVD